jgi:hypothetical protein
MRHVLHRTFPPVMVLPDVPVIAACSPLELRPTLPARSVFAHGESSSVRWFRLPFSL